MPEYRINFRCYYAADRYYNHWREMPLEDIPRWIEAYRFTHPEVLDISALIYFYAPDNAAG